MALARSQLRRAVPHASSSAVCEALLDIVLGAFSVLVGDLRGVHPCREL